MGTVKNLVQVNKSQARKAFGEGKEIYVLPCNIGLNDVWIKPSRFSNTDGSTFDALINMYEIHNCNNNRVGKYAHYFIYK